MLYYIQRIKLNISIFIIILYCYIYMHTHWKTEKLLIEITKFV